MRHLYEVFDFLPGMMQQSAVALVIIMTGYLLSLIFSAAVRAIAPAADMMQENRTPSPDIRISRICFWGLFLIFLILGFSQLPLPAATMEKWKISSENISVQAIIFAGAVIIMIAEPWISRVFKSLKVINPIGPMKLNGFLGRVLGCIGLILIIVTTGFALDAPKTAGLKFAASFLLTILGAFMGGVVKNALSSLLNIRTNTDSVIPKFAFSLVLATFLFTAAEVWFQ